MADLDTINRHFNKCERTLYDLARILVNSELEPTRENIKAVVEAVEILVKLQQKLFVLRPDLEYHYDGEREPTGYMLEIRAYITKAHQSEEIGDLEQAAAFIRKALAMEPPSLTHEILTKRLREISRGNT